MARFGGDLELIGNPIMNIKSVVVLFLVMIVWGVNFSVIKIGLGSISPWLLSASRFLFVVFPAILFVPKPQCHWKWVVLFGLFSGVLQFSLLAFGIEEGMSPGLASVVLQVHVFFTIIVGIIFLKEKINMIDVLGLIVGFSGLFLLGSSKDTNTTLLAVALVVLSALSWAFANVVTKKAGSINMLSFIVWSSLIPVVPLLAVSLYFDGWDEIVRSVESIDLIGSASLFYISYITTIFGFGCWSIMIKLYGSASVAPFTLMVPVFGILSDYLIFGSQLTSIEIFSAVCIFVALVIIVLGNKFADYFFKKSALTGNCG
jgi:O-acetylserine/cysteine efflux transporter